MANLAFMTSKYIFEAALLNFFLAWGLLKRPAAAVRTAARFWWLFLTSGLLQGLAYYLVNRYFTETTFTLRYVLMNGLTMLLFWRIALRQPWQLSLFLLSHVLITNAVLPDPCNLCDLYLRAPHCCGHGVCDS